MTATNPGGRAVYAQPVQACRSCGEETPDGHRFCGFCGATLAAPVVERRKLATSVFCDLSGSTAMGERVDAESVLELMRSYFDVTRAALERHGGTVEKFIGDAVVGVFGVPEAHEDDALRACRAALEMQARIAGLNEGSSSASAPDRRPDRRQHRRGRRPATPGGDVRSGDASCSATR